MTVADGQASRLCAVSFKPCWRDANGRWFSSGGFPLQMRAIGSLFDEMVLMIVQIEPRPEEAAGGIPLPDGARIEPLRSPVGGDARRKISVVARLPYYLWKIGSAIRKADVVHVPVPGDISLLGMLMSLLQRKHLIVRYGGSWPSNSQTTPVNRFTKSCMRYFAGGRNVMLATGSGPTPPAPGVQWIFSTALSAAELGRVNASLDRGLSDPPRLVYAGRLSVEKGVATLLRALGELARDGFEPLPRLVIAGDGPERGELEALASALGIADRVEFAGQLSRDALSRAFTSADVCVQPSLTEGFSKAWLDAMAHGLPVLASNVGAAEAVIGANEERGWLVPPGDVAALVAALRRVLSGPVQWPALRARCHEYVQGRTLEAWAEEIGRQCAAQWSWTLANGRLHR